MWSIFLLLLGLAAAQNKNYFEWTPVKITRHPSSLVPQSDGSTTSSYDSRYYDTSAPYHGSTGFYPDSSMPYINDDSYQDSYSPDFPKAQAYPYPDDVGSFENYGYAPVIRDENFNVTVEKYGGFGGTGDTRGYGAYDYPKKVHQDVPQDLHETHKFGGNDFSDLLRLGRSKTFRRRNPGQAHPLPPPL